MEDNTVPNDVANFLINTVRGVSNKRKVHMSTIAIPLVSVLYTLKKKNLITNQIVKDILNEQISFALERALNERD